MKKVLYYLIIMLAFTLNACDNEMDNMQGGDKEILTSSSEIVIKDGKITYPKWLVNVVDSVAHSHVKGTDYPYPWVFTIQGDGKEHILVLDGVNSCASCGQLLFLLSGERIEKFPNEWITMENLNMIWEPNLNVETKAQGAAATVYTPNGTLVNDTYYRSEELSASQKANHDQYCTTTYSQATLISSSTTTYNCHAYAWYMTEGGSAVWMGWTINPTNVYWLDGSYISTTGAATKVSYLSDNHSAVTTSTPNIFISKWGEYALMRHPKAHCPFDASSLKYMKKNDMPTVYIGKSQEDYSSGSSSINAPGGNATTTLYAYTKTGTPTSYSWNAEFYGECDRWYTYPSGNRLDVSVYLNSQHYGGSLRITCAMYNGSSLIGTATYYLNVNP